METAQQAKLNPYPCENAIPVNKAYGMLREGHRAKNSREFCDLKIQEAKAGWLLQVQDSLGHTVSSIPMNILSTVSKEIKSQSWRDGSVVNIQFSQTMDQVQQPASTLGSSQPLVTPTQVHLKPPSSSGTALMHIPTYCTIKSIIKVLFKSKSKIRIPG